VNYVTAVSEGGQHPQIFKDEGYKTAKSTGPDILASFVLSQLLLLWLLS
jgi:hypothetical protein